MAVFGHFRQNTNFPEKSDSATFYPLYPLPSCKKSEKSLEPILVNIRKGQFLGQFCPFLAIFGQMRIFFKKRAPLRHPTQKSRKILRAVNREKMLRTHARTHGRTDKHEFIGPPQAVQKSEKSNEPILRKLTN